MPKVEKLPKVKDFLNPQSMLTPGIAGGLVVSISLPLAPLLGLKTIWMSLIVSFLFGLLLIYSITDPIPRMQRALYCVLNSLVVFSTAVGVAVNVNGPPTPPTPPELKISMHEQEPARADHSVLSTIFGIAPAMATQHDKPPVQVPQAAKPSGQGAAQQTSERVGLTKEQVEKVNRYNRDRETYIKRQKEYDDRWSWK